MKAQMNRREFLASLVIATNLQNSKNNNSNLEAKLQKKIQNSPVITPYLLKQIKSLKPVSETNISIIYDIFEDISDNKIATGSMNFNKNTRIMDLGIDDFPFFTDVLLTLGSSFLGSIIGTAKKCKALYDLEDIRNFVEFDKDFIWNHYRESIPIRGNPKAKPFEYELIGKTVILKSKQVASSKKLIQNPLSVAFEILNGKKPTNFEMVANNNYSKNIEIIYKPYNGLENFMTVEVNFENPVIKHFKKVHALVYNNIPIAGYIQQDDPDMQYIRGELADLKIDGKTIFENIK